MRRGQKVLVGVLATCALLAGAAYLDLRPQWKTATLAELAKAIDPVLLRKEPADLAAEERFALVLRLLTEIGEKDLNKDRAREILIRLRDVLRKGPLQMRKDETIDLPSDSGANVHSSLLGLASAIPNDVELDPLDLEALLMHRLAGVSEKVEISEFGRWEIARLAQTVDLAVEAGKLSPDRAESALKKYFWSDPAAEGARRRCINYFQTSIYPVLCDPSAYVRRQLADPKSGFGKEFMRNLEDFARDPENIEGSYDPVETAKIASDLCMEWIGNLKGSWRMKEAGVEAKINARRSALPLDESISFTGWRRQWEKIRYRYRLAHTANSFGLTILSTHPVTFWDSGPPSICSAYHALAGVKLAAYVFMRRYGRRADDLHELVRANLLPKIPLDPLGTGPLRYDAKRRLAWSVGNDGKDDRGAGRPATLDDQDISFRMP